MASFLPSLWRCSTCTFAENKWAAMVCTMCIAVAHGKHPALPVPGAITMVRPRKLSRKAAEAKKKPPPPDVAIAKEPRHLSGIIVEIVRTERSNQGRSCEEYPNCGEVMVEDVIVHLWKVQFLVEGREDTAIAAVWINDGIDCCHIGFLPWHSVKHAARYDGAVAQCTWVFSGDANACDTAERHVFHKNSGCCLTRPTNFSGELTVFYSTILMDLSTDLTKLF
jgi:hypothetical protein